MARSIVMLQYEPTQREDHGITNCEALRYEALRYHVEELHPASWWGLVVSGEAHCAPALVVLSRHPHLWFHRVSWTHDTRFLCCSTKRTKEAFFDCLFALSVHGPPPLLEFSSAHDFHCRIGPTSHHRLQYDSEITLQMALEQGETHRHLQFLLRKR